MLLVRLFCISLRGMRRSFMRSFSVIKVLIVDDSSFMRRALSSMLSRTTDIQVVGTAIDGLDALKKAKELDPDVMTMDVEMPRMDGLTTVQQIMKSAPCPIIMVSSLTEEGAETTLKALEYGALDFIPKNMGGTPEAFCDELVKKIRAVARKKALLRLRYSRINHPLTSLRESPAPQPAFTPCRGQRDLVAIGVSTGGPPAVQKILSQLPANFPACILIAQHMPATFTGPFAKRLDAVSKLTVTEAADGDKLRAGCAYVCPGGKHMRVVKHGALPEISISPDPQDALYKPSVTVLMESVGQLMGRRALGVMLTGMGSDGCEGAKILAAKGGYMLAQNETSCVVYGMPKAVVDAGIVNHVVDIDQMAEAIATAVRG